MERYNVDPLVDPLTDPKRPYWIATDEAYGATGNMLAPWPGTGLSTRDPPKDAFNYHFSGGIRNCIERLFGQVYQRWGILWRPLRFSHRKVPHIVQALFQLHNFLIDFNNIEIANETMWELRPGEKQRPDIGPDGFDNTIYRQDQVATEVRDLPRLRPNTCPIRDQITKWLGDNYVTRPVDAQLIR